MQVQNGVSRVDSLIFQGRANFLGAVFGGVQINSAPLPARPPPLRFARAGRARARKFLDIPFSASIFTVGRFTNTSLYRLILEPAVLYASFGARLDHCVLFRGVSGERKKVPFNFPWRAPVHADISGVSMQALIRN